MGRFINKLSGTSVVNNKKHEGHEEKPGDGKDNNNTMCLSGGLQNFVKFKKIVLELQKLNNK